MSLEQLAASAAQRSEAFDAVNEQRTGDGGFSVGDVQSFNDNSKKAFYREFQKVVEESDVVLEVLDARDPMGTRALDVEERIRSMAKKRLIIVLNKIGGLLERGWRRKAPCSHLCSLLAFQT